MKQGLLFVAKYLGLFHLCFWLTRHQARILCYHGVAQTDEHLFRPGLFIEEKTFLRRLEILARWPFSFRSLDDFYRSRKNEVSQSWELLITIDDGWASTATKMIPQLVERGWPATLYVSTYFVENQRPVFKVAVAYLFWKHHRNFAVANGSVLYPVAGESDVGLTELLQLAGKLGSECEQELLEELLDYFGEDVSAWNEVSKLRFLSPEQIRRISASGIDLQYHTHRHKFSELGRDDAKRELADNARAIYELSGQYPRHFCYPRGEFTDLNLSLLRDESIHTATTTANELVRPGENLLALPRIVDSNSVSDIEFESEVTGFSSVLRSLRAGLRSFTASAPPS